MQQPVSEKFIIPIVIDTPFAVGKVYSYLIKDEKIVLVDCGHKSDASLQRVKTALNGEGLVLSDIDEIWLTHGHPDHFGQAALLAGQSGALLKGHRKERANFAGNVDGALFEDFFQEHGIPAEQIKLMVDQLEWLQQYQQPIEPDWIAEGDILSSGKLNFKVKHTPGHAPGHVTFYSSDGLFFSGDVLLEHISTNALINFDPDTQTRNKSLLQYRKALRWMKTRQGLVMPGHGKRIKKMAEIAGHHLTAQNERYQKIIELLRSQPRRLMELSRILFPDALENGAHFLVFSEIIGYLDWGVEEETIKKEKTNAEFIFSAA